MKSVIYFTVRVQITHKEAFSSTENLLRRVDGDMMFQFISADDKFRVTEQEITKRTVVRINEGSQMNLFERS